jgi:hypothetical protein
MVDSVTPRTILDEMRPAGFAGAPCGFAGPGPRMKSSFVPTSPACLGTRRTWDAPRVDHAVDVGLHRRLLDAVEVVAHAHVEAERLGLAFGARVEHLFQQVQRKPGFQVFVEGLGQRVLGRPLGVVALVLGIDAGLGDLQTVHDLHRLQLDEAPTGQPRSHDVLRQLRVRPGRRPDRCLAGLAEDLDQAIVGLAIELVSGDFEDRTAGLVFAEDARQQSFERDGTHDVAHETGRPLILGYQKSGPPCLAATPVRLGLHKSR